MKHLEIKKEILEICQFLNQKNMLAAADGNISFRISDHEILMTPTGKNKAHIKIEDIAVIDLANNIISGNPSGERLMHLEIYKKCPKAKAVVHAHPPTAIAWSVAKPEWKELPSECLSEVILAVGNIPIAPYARPGTESMGTVLHPFLPKNRVMILARHGALSWGEDLQEAFNGMERLEHICTILKSAYELGSLSTLPKEEVAVLKDMRSKMGDRTL